MMAIIMMVGREINCYSWAVEEAIINEDDTVPVHRFLCPITHVLRALVQLTKISVIPPLARKADPRGESTETTIERRWQKRFKLFKMEK